MSSYQTFVCGLNENQNPEKACCDICSGRGGCYDLIKEGIDGIGEYEHCVRCGDWWGDKGILCSECERYFCPSFWQNFFIFSPDCEDEREDMGWDTVGWDTMEGVCPECFASHPEWWCDCDNSCKTSRAIWSHR